MGIIFCVIGTKCLNSQMLHILFLNLSHTIKSNIIRSVLSVVVLMFESTAVEFISGFTCWTQTEPLWRQRVEYYISVFTLNTQ